MCYGAPMQSCATRMARKYAWLLTAEADKVDRACRQMQL